DAMLSCQCRKSFAVDALRLERGAEKKSGDTEDAVFDSHARKFPEISRNNSRHHRSHRLAVFDPVVVEGHETQVEADSFREGDKRGKRSIYLSSSPPCELGYLAIECVRVSIIL